MYQFLNTINDPIDLRKISPKDLPVLAEEVRDFILDIVSTKSGHLGASLGVVELSIALHYFYNTPEDLLIWDVGHQSYAHKLLTGRKSDFENLRQWNGMSGFPDRNESVYDAFGVGHSSTSISAITGMALANRLKSKKKKHIAVIGDASIVSGMALEGLNHLGDTQLDVSIILNDNNIGIDPAVGALQHHFNQVENSKKSDFFNALGFYYYGPIDGHNFEELFNAFEALKNIHQPKILHIKTLKGKGYANAEKDQVLWHSPGKFNKQTGMLNPKPESINFQHIVGGQLIKLFEKNDNFAAITPAMPTGSGLVSLMQKFPERVWDVGIAEQHAVTLSAGLATQGFIPFCVIYSTFLQRAYDQIIHDVALQNLPVVFLIDRAGLVGTDGATHHGYFDISFLNSIPNMTVACPGDANELEDLLTLASQTQSPFSIRYPKSEIAKTNFLHGKTEIGKAKMIKKGEKLAVLSTGHIAENIHHAIKNTRAAWFHFPFVKPIDYDTLKEIFSEFESIITYEHGVQNGGFGTTIADFARKENFKGDLEICAYPDEFIAHGNMKELEDFLNFDVDSIRRNISQYFI